MTNETTASQPKSIGDDAQFHELFNTGAGFDEIAAYIDNFRAPAAQASATIQAAPDAERPLRAGRNLMDYAKRAGWPDDGEGAFEFLQRKFYAAGEQYAASKRTASMTLTDAQIAEIYEQATSYPLSDADHHGAIAFARGIIKSLDATIQEPVMVAEPVGHELMQQLGTMRAVLHTAMLRAYPDKSHAEITAEIDRSLGAAPMVADPAGVAALTLGEVFASVGGWMNGGELGYPSFGSMDALRVFTQRSIRAALAATVKAVPSEALTAKQVRADEWRAVAAYLESQQGLLPEEMKTVRLCATVIRKVAQSHLFDFAAPLADKTGGGE